MVDGFQTVLEMGYAATIGILVVRVVMSILMNMVDQLRIVQDAAQRWMSAQRRNWRYER